VLVNSFATPGPGATRIAIGLDNFLLAMAMAALGLTTHWSSVRAAGARPLVLAALLFAWLVAGGALINRCVMGFVP
jgi:uncharacterized membrane protein YadS